LLLLLLVGELLLLLLLVGECNSIGKLFEGEEVFLFCSIFVVDSVNTRLLF
jgi:hypothetical protein